MCICVCVNVYTFVHVSVRACEWACKRMHSWEYAHVVMCSIRTQHTRVHAHIHTRVYVCACESTCENVGTCIRVSVSESITCTNIRERTCLRVRTRMCVYVLAGMHVRECVYMHVYGIWEQPRGATLLPFLLKPANSCFLRGGGIHYQILFIIFFFHFY